MKFMSQNKNKKSKTLFDTSVNFLYNKKKGKFMEDIFNFIVSDEMFDKIKSGKKTIHIFIRNIKQSKLEVKNQITFLKKDDEEKNVIHAEIENIFYFDDFMSAVETLGREKCGFGGTQAFEKTSDKFLAGENSYLIIF